jgi:hypothetical protein
MNMHSQRGGSFFAFVLGLALGTAFGVFVLPGLLREKPQPAAPAAGKEVAPPQVPAGPAQPEATPAVEADPRTAVEPKEEDWAQRKLREWGLSPEDLRRMSESAGGVITREGGKLGEMASDVRIVAVIKAKYTLDDKLSGWDIIVGCADGHVTLGGSVDSPDLIGRAIVLALDTSGVVDVVSSVRVKPPAPPKI